MSLERKPGAPTAFFWFSSLAMFIAHCSAEQRPQVVSHAMLQHSDENLLSNGLDTKRLEV